MLLGSASIRVQVVRLTLGALAGGSKEGLCPFLSQNFLLGRQSRQVLLVFPR